MIALTDTTHSLEMVTTSSIGIDYVASYADLSSPNSFTISGSQGSVASATDTTVVAAPGAGVQRQVKEISVKNTGDGVNGIILQKDVSGTEYTIFSAILASGESISYSERFGFRVLDAAGAVKSIADFSPYQLVLYPPSFTTANVTTTKTLTSTFTFATYLGRIGKPVTSASIKWLVATAATNVTWAEVALAKGAINIGGNPTLTVVGYTSVAAQIASVSPTGIYQTGVDVAVGQYLSSGDDLWALIGHENAAGVTAILRGCSADDLQIGVYASKAEQPSLNVGVASVYTIDGATDTPVWTSAIVRGL